MDAYLCPVYTATSVIYEHRQHKRQNSTSRVWRIWGKWRTRHRSGGRKHTSSESESSLLCICQKARCWPLRPEVIMCKLIVSRNAERKTRPRKPQQQQHATQ